MNYFSRSFWAIIILVAPELLLAKVDPPNYDFSLDQFQLFMPGKPLKEMQEKFGAGEQIKKKGSFVVYKFYVAHIRYKFPVLVQIKDGAAMDFYARLPAYFLHDIFHQSIINRFGQQDFYQKVEEQAVYVWKNKNGLRHVYSGACSITCFPVYYAVFPERKDLGSFTPLIKQMQEPAKF